MSSSFDIDRFNLSLGSIFAKSDSFTFEECACQIEQLRTEYGSLHDPNLQTVIDREIDRMMLRIVIDNDQPFGVVSECFWHNVNRGFNSIWSEVYSVLEYADYCLINEQSAEGIQVLLNVRHRTESLTDNITEELKHDLLLQIDETHLRIQKQTRTSP